MTWSMANQPVEGSALGAQIYTGPPLCTSASRTASPVPPKCLKPLFSVQLMHTHTHKEPLHPTLPFLKTPTLSGLLRRALLLEAQLPCYRIHPLSSSEFTHLHHLSLSSEQLICYELLPTVPHALCHSS